MAGLFESHKRLEGVSVPLEAQLGEISQSCGWDWSSVPAALMHPTAQTAPTWGMSCACMQGEDMEYLGDCERFPQSLYT